MRNEEIVSSEKLLELAQAYGRQYEAETEMHEKRYIVGAFLTVAVCVIGPVVWFWVFQ
jgi:hypothetical protein